MTRWFKRLLCRHRDLEFARNIHGDEIRERGWKRSLWQCTRCGAVVPKTDLHYDTPAFVAGAEAQKLLDQQAWNRMHHAFKACGIHPGRTDDDLCEVLTAAWQQRTEEIAALQKAANFWKTAFYEARDAAGGTE